jgi:dihydrofolate reductase
MLCPRRIDGYAIISKDGMLANAAGIMPDSLKFAADQQFFKAGSTGSMWWCMDAVLMSNRHLRHRLILTRQVPAIAADPSNEKALFWNPAGASFEAALAALGTPEGSVDVVGGTDVFGLFLDRFDVFHLSRALGVQLPGGRPVFPGVPKQTPEQVRLSMASPPASGRYWIRQKA